MSDLKTIFDAIINKAGELTALRSYYDGRQPTVYLTQRMREIFRPLDISFTENWCAVTINACDERINLNGLQASDKSAMDLLKRAWDRNELGNESSDIHTNSQIMGDAYLIAWPGEDGLAEAFFNDSRMVHAIYYGNNPRKIRVAGKLWTGDDERQKLTLYYEDRIEFYTAPTTGEVSSALAFVPAEQPTAPNPYGIVPVFHFRINRYSISDLLNVLPLQNGINKLLSDMMVAAEFGAYQQRWIISDSDISGVKNAPGEILDLPAGDGTGQDTSVGTFSATELKNYMDAINNLASAVGTITNTPKHYFFGESGTPSGEALIAMEAPLTKKAKDRIDRFTPVWRKVGAFICQIEGMSIDPSEITPDFASPETVQPKTVMEIVKSATDSGVPLETALKRFAGWSQAEIDTMNKLKEAEDAKKQQSLATSLLKAQQAVKTQPLDSTQDSEEIQDGNKPA